MRILIVLLFLTNLSFTQEAHLHVGTRASYFTSRYIFSGLEYRFNNQLGVGVSLFDVLNISLYGGYSIDRRLDGIRIPNDFSNLEFFVDYRPLSNFNWSPVISLGLGRGMTHTGKGEICDYRGHLIVPKYSYENYGNFNSVAILFSSMVGASYQLNNFDFRFLTGYKIFRFKYDPSIFWSGVSGRADHHGLNFEFALTYTFKK